MIRNPKALKAIALFFLVNILVHTFGPALLYAESGPVAPEYVTFASAGYDNMVHPLTGDFNYNAPLFEIPGPSGNYAVNIFYSAGIKPDQDASWVGLGWNINAGAINRYVNGFADDIHKATYTVTDTWQSSTPTDYGIDFPLGTSLSSTGIPSGASLPVNTSNQKYFTNPLDAGTGYMFGSLHGYGLSSEASSLKAYDCYASNDPTKSLVSNPDPEKVMAGSFPAYDIYSVSAQGYGGIIEPVVLEDGSLVRRKITTGANVDKVFLENKTFTQSKQQFRFKGDFSNSFKVTPNNFGIVSNVPSFTAGGNGLGYTYTGPDALVGFNTSNFRLAGSQHVEYFTNSEIVSGTAKSTGFINYQGLADGSRNNLSYSIEGGQTRAYDVSKQTGGFSITSSDGQTYHYALPVYTYNNYKESTSSGKTFGRTKRSITNYQAHAYTWLLTSITGPDFVDRNNNGYADELDFGSWVNFSYGKWADNYIFRSPYTGTSTDVDGSQTYSFGRKELYYLDAIYTRSHTALFAKNWSRYDGKSTTDTINGGGSSTSVSSLKLDAVYLYENDGLKSALALTKAWNTIQAVKALYSNSIIDYNDLSNLSSSYSSTNNSKIKKVSFTYDYSLCDKTPNSFDTGTPSTKLGKLSLKQIDYAGRNNVQEMPPLVFTYDLVSPQTSSSTNILLTTISGRNAQIDILNNASGFITGDMVKFTSGGTIYYATLVKAIPSTTKYEVIFLGPIYPSSGGGTLNGTLTQTKNPPYTNNAAGNTDFYDIWGYFKSDFRGTAASQNNTRMATSISASGMDAWSLRRVKTQAGALLDVTYEADSYTSSEVGRGIVFNMSDLVGYKGRDSVYYYSSNYNLADANGSEYKLYFADPDTANVLNYFTVGEKIKLATFAAYQNPSGSGSFAQYGEATENAPVILAKGWESGRGNYLRIKFYGNPPAEPSHETNNLFRYGYHGSAHTVEAAYASYKMLHYGSIIIVENNPLRYGGGLRVKATKVSENANDFFENRYEYSVPVTGITSGSTAFEPTGYDGLKFNYSIKLSNSSNPIYSYTNFATEYQKYYDRYLHKAASLMNIARELPVPNVLYEFVTVREYGNNKLGPKHNRYQYQVFRDDMVQYEVLHSNTTGTGNLIATVKYTDYTARLGSLLSLTTLDKYDRIISEISYTYDDGTNIPNNQGVLEQVFNEQRVFNQGTGSEHHKALMSVKSKYPSVLLSATTKESLKGTTETNTSKAFDFYSGQVTEASFTDIYNNTFKTKSIPAYTKYSSMGLRVHTNTNKHMISSAAGMYTFRINAGTGAVIDTFYCKIQTWSNSWTRRSFNSVGSYYSDATSSGIWRPYESWSWNSPNLKNNGAYNNFIDYNFAGSQSAGWQMNGNKSKYDPFSRCIEDLGSSCCGNSNYLSAKYGYDLSLPLIDNSNSKFSEITFSGAEDLNTDTTYGSLSYFGGEVGKGTGAQDATIAHTGTYSLRVNQGENGFIYKTLIDTNNIERGKDYRANVWIYDNGNTTAKLYYEIQNTSGSVVSGSPSGFINLATATTIVKAGKWKLLSLAINIPGSVSTGNLLVIGCKNDVSGAPSAYFDDLRFYPLDYPVICNVYDVKTKQLTHTFDKDHFYMRYAYDEAGRVIGTYKETINGEITLNESKINYPNN